MEPLPDHAPEDILPDAPVPDSDLPTILLDMDGVTAWQNDRMTYYARQEYGADLHPEDITEWDFTIEGTDKTYSEIAAELIEKRPAWYFSGMNPVEGAVDAIQTLAEHGYRIRVATHRNTETHHLTARWLREHDIPAHEIEAHVPKNKANCAETRADILIDDRPLNILLARQRGVQGILYRQPYNEHEGENVRSEGGVVGDWDEIQEMLLPRPCDELTPPR